jgi:uncharacterized membrane protein
MDTQQSTTSSSASGSSVRYLSARDSMDARDSTRAPPDARPSGSKVRESDRIRWQQGRTARRTEERLARGLAWLGVGIGLAELFAARRIARAIGVGNHTVLIRSLGVREIAVGIGALTSRRPTVGMWSRVAGDAMDLALLGAAFTSPRADRSRLALATAAIVGVTALDAVCAQRLSALPRAVPINDSHDGSVKVAHRVAVSPLPEECYAFWRELENLPRFMEHLQSVERRGNGTSHWVAKAPLGRRVEWDSEITDDRPNELLAWRSLPGSDVESAGVVRFERLPGDRGTLVDVELRYRPPGGAVGEMLAEVTGEAPQQQVEGDLRRFKQMIEAGEIATTRGQSSGRRSLLFKFIAERGTR